MIWPLLFVLTTADADSLQRALSARHMDTTCESLAENHAATTQTFVELADTVDYPAWVSVRAARCVGQLGTPGELQSAAAHWQGAAGLRSALLDVVELRLEPIDPQLLRDLEAE